MAMERVGLEACSLTAWLQAGLSEAGVPAVCIEARQAKAAMGAMPNKTDRNDARGIAQMMRTGWYRAWDVKGPGCRARRARRTRRRGGTHKRRDVGGRDRRRAPGPLRRSGRGRLCVCARLGCAV